MDEPINQDEMCLNTLEKDLGITIDENKHITQFDIIEQSIEDNQTTETLSYPEPNTENITSMIDESDDEPLLSIPPRPNNRKICSDHWLEILVGTIIFVFVATIITAGILLVKDFNAPSTLSPSPQPHTQVSTKVKGCNKLSETGKSCSIDNLETTTLISIMISYSQRQSNYFIVYTATSNTTIITFSFDKGSTVYLDEVSMRDKTNGDELIEDGGFESGTMYAYCVCGKIIQKTQPWVRKQYKGFYVCEIGNYLSTVKLSQVVKTIDGRTYNVSFWLESDLFTMTGSHVTVYMSKSVWNQ